MKLPMRSDEKTQHPLYAYGRNFDKVEKWSRLKLEGQAGQAAAQGSRRALDRQIQQAKPREDGSMPPVDLAIPRFGYQNHISIDRRPPMGSH